MNEWIDELTNVGVVKRATEIGFVCEKETSDGLEIYKPISIPVHKPLDRNLGKLGNLH